MFQLPKSKMPLSPTDSSEDATENQCSENCEKSLNSSTVTMPAERLLSAFNLLKFFIKNDIFVFLKFLILKNEVIFFYIKIKLKKILVCLQLQIILLNLDPIYQVKFFSFSIAQAIDSSACFKSASPTISSCLLIELNPIAGILSVVNTLFTCVAPKPESIIAITDIN